MTRRHDSKISAIFWGIILIFPFIWFVLSFIAYVQPFSDNSVVLTFGQLESFLNDFLNSNNVITIITQPLAVFLASFVSPGFDVPVLTAIVFTFVVYYILIHILRLAVDVVLFIPHLFHSWISKFDRKVE